MNFIRSLNSENFSFKPDFEFIDLLAVLTLVTLNFSIISPKLCLPCKKYNGTWGVNIIHLLKV